MKAIYYYFLLSLLFPACAPKGQVGYMERRIAMEFSFGLPWGEYGMGTNKILQTSDWHLSRANQKNLVGFSFVKASIFCGSCWEFNHGYLTLIASISDLGEIKLLKPLNFGRSQGFFEVFEGMEIVDKRAFCHFVLSLLKEIFVNTAFNCHCRITDFILPSDFSGDSVMLGLKGKWKCRMDNTEKGKVQTNHKIQRVQVNFEGNRFVNMEVDEWDLLE